MQPKESKSSRHFYTSLIKSIFRLGACVWLGTGNLVNAAILLGTAEILGIIEEL